MKDFKPIAMRCTQEQFDKIKPKLINCSIVTMTSFKTHPHLVNNYIGENGITNVIINKQLLYGRTVFEEWDEKTFLEYCGIPTLTLDDAYIVECEDSEETNKVINFITNKSYNCNHWKYVINHKGLLHKDFTDNNIFDSIPTGVSHLPIISFQEWEELFNQIKKQPMAQKLTITANEVLELHSVACCNWKAVFVNYLTRISPEQTITFTQEEVHDMFVAATKEQYPTLIKIFGKKEEHFPDGTPCLVSNDDKCYALRYANGEGEFYTYGKKSGSSCFWEYSRKLDLNNLPVNEN